LIFGIGVGVRRKVDLLLGLAEEASLVGDYSAARGLIADAKILCTENGLEEGEVSAAATLVERRALDDPFEV
jgi:hypothetical protein